MFSKRHSISSEPSNVDEKSLENGKLREKLKEHSDFNFGVLKDLNELLKSMTSLDYVKQMIMDVNEQTKMVENLAASSQEMSSTAEDVSNFAQNSYNASSESIIIAQTSLSKIDGTFSFIEENMDKTRQVKSTMESVTRETEKIYDIVNVINNIAKQTNLLALNASIEAARAGQQGKGFAVVAEEIEKLSESSKIQANHILAIVNSLKKQFKDTSESLDNVVTSFNASKKSIDEAVSLINGIGKSMETIGTNFSAISSNSQEQTAASEEMAANTNVINEKTLELKAEANRTGKAFYDISLTIDMLRRKLYSATDGISNSTMLELCITDHIMWKWRVYNLLLGFVNEDFKKVSNHRECRLGVLLNNLSSTDVNVINIVEQLEQPHSKLHTVTNRAIDLYHKGNIAESEALLGEIEQTSQDVVALIDKLKLLLE